MAHKKAGGRAKGTPNKKTQELHDIAERCGVNIFEGLCRIAAGDYKSLGYENERYITPELRFQAMKEAAKYLYPQRKAVELSSDVDTGFKIIVEDFVTRDKK